MLFRKRNDFTEGGAQEEDAIRPREENTPAYAYETNNGKEVACVQCEGQLFYEERALLNTRGFTFFNLDWLNEDANLLICRGCGYVHWFVQDIHPTQDK
ncbi:hypothetical protein B0H94_12121 [Salsuginibacillus halophilus]|uniref:Uncharacterized protein n=1 Tax=Salsuginibacillus halophilus TaxID=517424 RepID=A0A2P8H3R4_9BACI|nr:hypothetical protein [Salsuginibacillus halophilus]PSL40856.1 hypothetical protein B0H94_12121 [Salsuginibacillus halophilus]